MDSPVLDPLAAAFDSSAAGLALLDLEGRPQRVNRALCLLAGRGADDLLALAPFHLGSAAEAADEARQRLAMRTGGLERYSIERQLERPGGGKAWVQQTCTLVRDPVTRRAQCLLLEVHDASDRKDLELELRETEERFRYTFEEAALGILFIDTRGQIIRVNRRICEMYGYPRDELVGRSAFDLMEDRGRGARDDISGLLRGQWRHYTAERRFVRNSGEVFPVRVSVSVARTIRGQPYLISMVEDLTKQKADERRMRRQAQMLHSANDAIIIHDEGRRIRYWNKGAERLFGWRAEQALGRTFAELMGPSSALTEGELDLLYRQGELIVNVTCRCCDGRMREIERRFTVVEGEESDATAVLSVNTDITERLAAQRELEQRNRDLQAQVSRASTSEVPE
jgi:PAS domain S-box-containing protein